jgi:predicted phosphoadenosine phosphosulfate sulfurtransferase
MFSAGKDSGVCLELAIIAARATGRLPVIVSMRDEEVMLPGTYEYAERVAARPEVDFYWWVANQPIINVFNRANPYWWVFDPLLEPEQWVRQPPAIARKTDVLDITRLVSRETFPTPKDKQVIAVTGIRAQESAMRFYSVFSAKGALTLTNEVGTRTFRPIYDWRDSDVWRAVHVNKWDYNDAYNAMMRFDVPVNKMRIAPPTLNTASVFLLEMARKAWPRWFDRLEARLPGVKTIAQFGAKAVLPYRRTGEDWKDTYARECINEAPAKWIADRATIFRDTMLHIHHGHSSQDIPDIHPCRTCFSTMGSWKAMTHAMYNGDPFALRASRGGIKAMDPEFFRKGSGTWGGFAPTW